VKRMAIAALLFAPLVLSAPLPKNPKTVSSLVGKAVYPRSNGIYLRLGSPESSQTINLTVLNGTVIADAGDWLEVEFSGKPGFLKRDEVVTVDEGIEYFSEQIAASKSVDLLIRRSAIYGVKREHDLALADINAAIEMSPGPAMKLNRALIHVRRRDFERALGDADDAVRTSPRYAAAHRIRGYVYGFLDQYEDAIADYKKAVELNPDSPYDLINLAKAQYAAKDYEAALKSSDRAVVLNDRQSDAHLERARANAKLKRDDAAERDFRRAIELMPKRGSANAVRAGWRVEQGRYDDANEDFLEATRRDPTEPSYMNARAWFLATCPDAKYRDGAVAKLYATRANDIEKGNSPALLDTLAAAHAELGEFDEAIAAMKKAMAIPMLTKKEQSSFAVHLASFEAKKPWRKTPSP